MKASELKGLRVAKKASQMDVAQAIEKSLDSYSKKERGDVMFTLDEAAAIAVFLGMSYEQFDAIFFDGKLPFGKISSPSLSLQ